MAMSEDALKTPAVENEPAKSSGAPNIAAYAVSGAVGLGYGASAVSNDFYNHLRNREVFKDPKDKLDKTIRDLFDVQKNHSGDVSKELREANRAYTKEVKEIIKSKGYGSLLKRFGSLNTNHKLDIGMKVFTAAGISLGVMFAVTNSKSLFSSIFSDKGKDDAPSR
jgi:hypothetical protein